MTHTFTLPTLTTHFIKNPIPPAASALIDQPGDQFLDTAEELSVIAASLYSLCVMYDKMEEKERPKNQDELRKWIIIHRAKVVPGLARKVEPPFSEYFTVQDVT